MTVPRHDCRRSAWHRHQNALIDQLNRLVRPGAQGRAQMGSAGVAFLPPPTVHLGLFELSGPLVYPEPNDPDATGAPYTEAASPVWYLSGDDQYGGANLGEPTTLYFPQALRDAEGRPLGTPALGPSMRCHAHFNPQSGRWEILAAALGMLRFEMTAALECGMSAPALPRLCVGGPIVAEDRTVTVHDTTRRFSKMATASGDVGALGWAHWLPDRQGWEILDMQTPGAFFGALKDDLSRSDASAVVEVVAGTGVLDGYNVFGENFGNEITAYNPPGGGNRTDYWYSGAAGDRVLCRWDIRGAKYSIVAVEPNNQQYQSLEVVTQVDFPTQTVAKKTIELPPWTELA